VSSTSSDWIPTVVAFGIVAGVGGVLAIVAYPIAGALSDRTVSRFGRRRPWIAGGVLLFAIALALLGLQHDLVTETILWALAVIGFCAASAALTAVVSDQVPAPQRGVVSTWVAAPNAIGTVLGVVLVGLVVTGQSSGYLVIAILLVLFCAPFIIRLRDAPLSRADRDAALAVHRSSGRGRSLRLRENPDFGWALASRILIYLGNALGTALLLYYFGFALHINDPEDFLVTAVLIYVAVTLVVAIIGGALSDRLDLRRPFVVVGGIAQGVAALLLALFPAPGTALVGAALLGLGWGIFLSVDQALTTGVLPDATARGRHLGVMNIAVAVPQNVGPLVGAVLVALTGGFVWLFVLAGFAAIAGALCVLRVHSVR